MKVRELLEKAPKKYPLLRKLVALFEDAGDDDTSDEPDERDHLYHAYKKMSESDPDGANKILGMLKCKPMQEDDEDGDGKGDPMEKEEKANKESKQQKPADPTVKQLQERLDRAELQTFIREACETRDIPHSKELEVTLLALKEHKAIEGHLDYLRKNGVKTKKSSAPRCRGSTGD